MVQAIPYVNKRGLDLRAPSLTTMRRGITLDSLRLLTLVASDCVLLSLTWQAAEMVSPGSIPLWNLDGGFLTSFLVIAIQLWFIAVHGLYGAEARRRDYLNLAKALLLAQGSVILLVLFYQPLSSLNWFAFPAVWLLTSVALGAGRFLIDAAIAQIRRSGSARYPSLIIGEHDQIHRSVRRLERKNRYHLLGWVDVNTISSEWSPTLEHIISLGISDVFLCSGLSMKNSMFLYWSLRNAGIRLHILPVDLEPPIRKTELLKSLQAPSITFLPPLIPGGDFWIKRTVDFCAALTLLILLSPLLLLIALLIQLDSPGPIFFKQPRMGLKNQVFKAWKFRTMVVNAEQMQKQLEAMNETSDGVLFKIKKDPRITRVGEFLRQYSLDELPQLFNVLFGEMSLVGPRPLPLRDIERFSKHHFIRHEVLPGITGLWQISGRSDIVDFEDVVRLDVTYIENWSLWLDLKILLKTVEVVLRKTGAY